MDQPRWVVGVFTGPARVTLTVEGRLGAPPHTRLMFWDGYCWGQRDTCHVTTWAHDIWVRGIFQGPMELLVDVSSTGGGQGSIHLSPRGDGCLVYTARAMSLTHHVAVAVDFSHPSEVALIGAFKLAEISGARVTMIHAHQKIALPKPEDEARMRAELDAIQERVTKGAIANVDALVKKLGLPAAAHEVVAGKPREIIPETVKRIGATLLVLGTHARRGLSRMFMGSVAESILADVAVPALIMHVGSDHIPPDRELEELDRAVIAVDLHEGSDRIAMAGLDLIRALKRPTVRATLLHVAHPHEHGEYRAAVSDSAKDQLEALRARCTSDDLPIDVRVVDGDAAEAIVDVAKEEDAEMIVVGRRAVGGVITQVIRRSPVIVLVVPASD